MFQITDKLCKLIAIETDNNHDGSVWNYQVVLKDTADLDLDPGVFGC